MPDFDFTRGDIGTVEVTVNGHVFAEIAAGDDCPLGTPVQFTVTSLPEMLVVAGFPAQVAEATALIGVAKLTTMVWLPVELPPKRRSIPTLPDSGRLISNVPASRQSLL